MTITHQWTGPNGTVIDLTNVDQGVWLSAAGIEGMGNLKHEAFTQDTTLVDGQTVTGWRGLPRDVFWPLIIDGRDGSWYPKQLAFWKTMRPNQYGTWRVGFAATYRELSCRFVDDGDGVYTKDPSIARLEAIPITMIADDPWWKGVPVVETFTESGDLTRTNYISNPQVATLDGFTAVNSATLALGTSAGDQYEGTNSAKVTTNSSANVQGLTYLGPLVGSQGTYTVSAWVKGPAGSQISFAGRVNTNTTRFGSATFTMTGSWVRCSATFNLVGVSYTSIGYTWQTTTAASGRVFTTAKAMLQTGSTLTTWFSGDTGFDSTHVFRWAGVRDASPSVERLTRTILVDGDVPVWPVVRVDGPVTEFTLTGIKGPITIPSGSWLIFDSDPRSQVAWLYDPNGTRQNVTKQLSDFGWLPLPPGVTQFVENAMVGSGSMTLTATPAYYRAF